MMEKQSVINIVRVDRPSDKCEHLEFIVEPQCCTPPINTCKKCGFRWIAHMKNNLDKLPKTS